MNSTNNNATIFFRRGQNNSRPLRVQRLVNLPVEYEQVY